MFPITKAGDFQKIAKDSDVKQHLLFTSDHELVNQNARKALFTCVVYAFDGLIGSKAKTTCSERYVHVIIKNWIIG